jgi:hypothetical protein
MTCCDCEEDILESERGNARRCRWCARALHGECAMLARLGDDACEECYTKDNSRFTFVMAHGSGEGRGPILEEGERPYLVALPDVDELLSWESSLAALDEEDK